MSQHYDFTLSLDLKPDTDPQVIAALAYMTRTEDYAFEDPVPDHPWFEYQGWRDILQDPADATHFPGDLWRVFRHAYRFSQGGVDHYRWTLSFRCYMLDDGFYEDWWGLAHWLARWSDTEGFVGYYREGFSKHPTLIYFTGGEVYIKEVEGELLAPFAGSDYGKPASA